MRRCEKTILISCFAPFGQDLVNSSALAVNRLPSRIGNARIERTELPVDFESAVTKASEIIEAMAPDMVMACGQAARRTEVCLERKGTDRNGHDERLTLWPVDEIARHIAAKGGHCRVSDSAGQYVCNHLYHSLLSRYPHLPILFVHLPATPDQMARRGRPDNGMPSGEAAHILNAILCAGIARFD